MFVCWGEAKLVAFDGFVGDVVAGGVVLVVVVVEGGSAVDTVA